MGNRDDLRVGVDVGGTFTDLITMGPDGPRIAKVPSTTPDQAAGVLAGIAALVVASPSAILHGSTVATNAILEGRGGRTALVTTEGFADVLEIARQNRPRLYEIEPVLPAPLIPRNLRFGVKERTDAAGQVLIEPQTAELAELAKTLMGLDIEAVAICFLHSYANPANEQAAAEALRAAGLSRISISSQVLPEFREYERTATVAANAYLSVPVEKYLDTLRREAPGPVWIVQSNGGLLTPEETERLPVRTVLSGPAGGVTGAVWAAGAAGFENLVTFDMGGTSTDVSLCPGNPVRTSAGTVGDIPIAIEMIDIHTVGSGGGSIAWVDEGGALRVGPRSAGSNPGPAAYGRGGVLPTVSDANVVLGRLPAGVRLAGQLELDAELAHRAIESLADQLIGPRLGTVATASAIVNLAEASMESALRLMTIEKGYDPRGFALVAFGGAGPLHACELAARLRMDTVLIPSHPGVLSALGALVADRVRSYSRTVMLPATAENFGALADVAAELSSQARRDLSGEGEPMLSLQLDLRYQGQSFELTVPWREGALSESVKAFHLAHDQRYSYAMPQREVQIVAIRLDAVIVTPSPDHPEIRAGGARPAAIESGNVNFSGIDLTTAIYSRSALAAGDAIAGPAVILQDDCTTFVPPDWRAEVDLTGMLTIRRTADAA